MRKLLLLLVVISGCAASLQEQERNRIAYIEQNPQLSEETIKCIRYGWLNMGMSKEQVILSIGKPGKVKKSTWESGEKETWEYGYFQMSNGAKLIRTETDPFFISSLFHTTKLYFENDKLVGWED